MIFLIAAIVLLLELFPFFSFLPYFEGHRIPFSVIYFSIAALSYFSMIRYLLSVRNKQEYYPYWSNVFVSFGFGWIVAKLLLIPVLLIGDAVGYLGTLEINQYIDYSGAIASFSLIVFLVYGVVFGKYHFKTRTVEVDIKNLPKAFDGFKVVQISDAHLGTFDSISGFNKGIEAIKATKPDLLLFTGDLVNNLATEAEPYIDYFKALKAKHGKFAILGNHDYADYMQWPNELDKKKNLERLHEIHSEMGFRLLDNEHVKIEKENETFYLAGIENWGLPPFPQYGDLEKALNNIPKNVPTLLMSHDPSHWDAQVKNHKHAIALTMSGHTHGMQFGIDLPFFKWSPVKFKYPKWAGLYSEGKKHLYVNRGFGFLGFPGRSGIRPEITELILRTEVV